MLWGMDDLEAEFTFSATPQARRSAQRVSEASHGAPSAVRGQEAQSGASVVEPVSQRAVDG